MIQGAATSLMFEIVWYSFTLFYPTAALAYMLSPDLELAMLVNDFWVVYIFAVLYSGLIFVNYDLILGDAARELEITNTDLVKTMTVTSTILATLTVIF